MYRKILIALDASDAACAAFVFANDWARHFDSELWFIQLTEESHGPRREIVTDVSRRGRHSAGRWIPAPLERSRGGHGPGRVRRSGRVGNVGRRATNLQSVAVPMLGAVAGSCATAARESSQGRKAAALSGYGRVP